jgi:transcriptional regulator with XRE-family HTH domain
MILGDRISKRIKALGTSQGALARAIGVSPQAVSKMVVGGTTETGRLYQIARELKTSPEYLTGETDDPASEGVDDALSSDERELIDLWQGIPPKDRAALLQLARTLSSCATTPSVHGRRLDYRST